MNINNAPREPLDRTPFIFDGGPDDLTDGSARFNNERGKFDFFGETGKTIVAPQFDFARSFSGGAAVCSDCKKTAADGDGHYGIVGGRWGYINRRGQIIVPLQYEEAENFKHGRARDVQQQAA